MWGIISASEVEQQTQQQASRWTGGQTDGRVDGLVDRQLDGWTDRNESGRSVRPVCALWQGPGDVIINDLHKTKTDNETLRSQVAQLQKTVRELQAVNAGLQDEYKRAKAALEAAQRSVEKARHDYKKLEVSFANLKAENDTLKQRSVSGLGFIADHSFTRCVLWHGL